MREAAVGERVPHEISQRRVVLDDHHVRSDPRIVRIPPMQSRSRVSRGLPCLLREVHERPRPGRYARALLHHADAPRHGLMLRSLGEWLQPRDGRRRVHGHEHAERRLVHEAAAAAVHAERRRDERALAVPVRRTQEAVGRNERPQQRDRHRAPLLGGRAERLVERAQRAVGQPERGRRMDAARDLPLASHLQQPRDPAREFDGHDRLGLEVVGACRERRGPHLRVERRRHKHDRQLSKATVGAHAPRRGHTVHARELRVDQEHRRPVLLELLEQALGPGQRAHEHPLRLADRLQHLEHRGVVVDHEHRRAGHSGVRRHGLRRLNHLARIGRRVEQAHPRGLSLHDRVPRGEHHDGHGIGHGRQRRTRRDDHLRKLLVEDRLEARRRRPFHRVTAMDRLGDQRRGEFVGEIDEQEAVRERGFGTARFVGERGGE